LTVHAFYLAGRGFRSSAIERSRVRMGQDFAGRAARERRLIYIPNLIQAGKSLDPAVVEGLPPPRIQRLDFLRGCCRHAR